MSESLAPALFGQVGQMADQGLAVHRIIVVVDVEGFGDQRRTNAHQVAVRAGLYRVMREAFDRAGISWDDCGVEDRGDGVFVLVPAEVPKGLLAESLPPALVTGLRAHNRAHPGPERIRLRMALHAGEVRYDEHGVTGASVNLAFRLVDAGSLKAALAGSPGVLAVIASSWFFDEVVRHIPSGADAAYRGVEVAVKETTATGWVCLPDQADPADRARPELPPSAAGLPGMQPTVALRTLPRDAAAFTGRARELNRLVAAVSQAAVGGVFGIHAVDGMAGIGKTAFAVHAAHQLAARFPDGQIFLRLYAHTAGQLPVDPAEALATLLLTIGVAPQQIPPGLEARSGLWRDHLAGKKMLLVLDDAAGSDQVRPLLPGAPGCLVLVTSRRRLTALEEAAPISLSTLSPGEAADLFVRLAVRSGLQPDHRAVAEVTRLCGYLPLAIRLVAAGIRHHPTWTVPDLTAELSTARDRLAAMQAEDVSVAAAFDLSYKDLTGGQQRLFRRLGLHPGTEIDAYAAAALDGTDLPAARRCLGELHDQNLIGEPARGRYRLHDLLREHARALAAGDDAADNQASLDRLLNYYLHAAVTASRHAAWRTSIGGPPLPGPAPAWAPGLRTEEEAITWLRTERANLHACIDYATTHARLTHAVCVLFAISDFLHNQGHWNEAVALGQAALAAACTIGDREGQAWALTELGTMQERTANYPAAAPSLARALQLFGDLGDRRGQAWALNQLGIVQLLTGDYPAATASLARALQLYQDLGDRRGQAWALNKLSVVQRRTGDYPAATATLTQTLQLFGDLGDRRGQAWALDDLGAVRQLTGDLAAASASLGQALQLSSDLGDRHCQAVVLRHLGMVQQRTGDYTAATASLTQALQLYQDLGDRHGQAGASINLGDLLSQSTAHNDALSYFAQALKIACDIGAPVLRARALEGIGRCHVRDGNPGRGTAYLRQALAIYQSIGAPEAKSVETALLEQPMMTTKGGATSG